MKSPTVKVVKSIYGIPYKTIKGVENENGTVSVYAFRPLFLINKKYPWVIVENLPSFESFIDKHSKD